MGSNVERSAMELMGVGKTSKGCSSFVGMWGFTEVTRPDHREVRYEWNVASILAR